MEIVYASKIVQQQCTSLKVATKFFGGNKKLAVSLLSRIQAIDSATTIQDIIVQPSFHFHKLKNKGRKNLEGYFAIDVKTHKEPWRIILQPLDDNKEPFIPCEIDVISKVARIIEIREVSKHYE